MLKIELSVREVLQLFSILSSLALSNGFKNVRNVIQITLKRLPFSEKLQESSGSLRLQIPMVCHKLEMYHLFKRVFKSEIFFAQFSYKNFDRS